MRYGIIIAAGKQSRFKSSIPKALVKINDKILLDENISRLSTFCDKIITITSYENNSYFEKYNNLAIDSGKGSGDAVLKALLKINDIYGFNEEDTAFIQWGDCLIDSCIYQKTLEKYSSIGIIPCVYEKYPYVRLSQYDKNKISATFSKFGEDSSEGFHDLSVFYFNCLKLLNYLKIFQSKILTNNNEYKHKHGNEMEFLDVFNETEIEGELLDFHGYQDFSFNTVEQLEEKQYTKS